MDDLREIPVTQIDRNPDQPRTMFDDAGLAELAESIRIRGVIQPIEVEATDDGRYRLHHGERRWRASKLAGRETIPAVVADGRDAETLLFRGLLENLHREDLNVIDEAKVFQALIREHGWTKTRVARETGRAMAIVAARLAWLELEPEIQRHVALGQIPRDGRLADALRGLPPEVRVPLTEKLAQRALGLKGSLGAVKRAAEKLAQRQAAEKSLSHEVRSTHPTPMLRHGANGSAQRPVTSIYHAAEAMCRECFLRPAGDVIPSWELVEQAAAETCAACQKKDGPAISDVCKRCPGVAMVKALVGKVAG